MQKICLKKRNKCFMKYSSFSSHIESELILNIFKCGLQALKSKPYFYIYRETLPSESFFSPPLCSVLSKLRFSLWRAPECWSRFVYKGVVSLSRVHQRHWNKRYLRNSENHKMLMLLFSPMLPLVTSEPLVEKRPKPKPTPPMISVHWAFVETSL